MPAFSARRVFYQGLLFAFSWSWTGCSLTPPPTIATFSAIDTSDTSGYWLNGRWVMTRSTPEYSLSIAYNGMRERNLEFGVTFMNDSRKKIDFNPDRIRLIYRDTVLEPFNSTRLSDSLQSEYALELAKTNPYSPNLVQITGSLLNATLGIVAALTWHQETESERKSRLEYEESEADREKSEREWEIDHKRRLQYLRSENEFWSEGALGRTTAFPGDSLSGLILFTHHVREDTVSLVIPFRQGEARFRWVQTESVASRLHSRSRSLAPTDRE